MTGAEHVDVLIVGAGVSGINAACRLRERCPEKTFAILEARDAIGGTWDLFRFPGIRSDSDMFTLCYPFRPWTGAQAIVEGEEILDYVRQTAHEYGIDARIRFHHRVLGAHWSSADARWTIDVERADTGEVFSITAGFLFSCTGYYHYDAGHLPEFAGIDRFGGEVVHPQFWSDDVDHDGKRVVVIGSGATAVTLVPALARRAAHVTMLQRSPSYILSLPAVDPVAGLLGRVLPAGLAYRLVRWKNVLLTVGIYELSRYRPATMKRLLRGLISRQLPAGYDVERHFQPRYDPWDQRMCLVPDGDLFEAISDGRVSVITDHIESFTENGIALASGSELDADLIVTATGLKMIPFGGISLSVDGSEVALPDALIYRGMLLTGVPNMAFAFGYVNQSWTLGSDLACQQVCRMLRHMDENGYTHCTPARPDGVTASVPFAELSSGYVQRAMHQFPRQAAQAPWRRHQNYVRDWSHSRRIPVDDPVLVYSSVAGGTAAEAAEIAA
jgi:cation diffusion facilitator CzcD-associated flavoprotein CzcO